MEHKRILVLANSYKSHGRCIAGREIKSDGSLGPWIRPISNHGEGEFNGYETRLADGPQVEVLQRVAIPLERLADDPYQPENWFVQGFGNWRDVSATCPVFPLGRLIESPSDLWQEPGRFADWVSHGWLQSNPPKRSLCVIRPENLRIRVESRDDKESHGNRERWRAVFRYRGVGYNLSITDPVFLHRHAAWPHGRMLPIEAPLRCEDDCLICVSLGMMWQGKHYKLAATIFENVP
jgi:hypothetical protein